MLEVFTTRELAGIIIGLGFFVFIVHNLGWEKMGEMGLDLWKSFYAFKWMLLIMSIYIAFEILILTSIFPNINVIKEIFIWCIFIPLSTLFKSDKIKIDKRYFKKLLLNSFKIAVILAFIFNFYTFHIIIELILGIIILIFTLTSSFSGTNEEKYKDVKIFSEYVLSIIGVSLLIFLIWSFSQEPDKLLLIQNIYIFLTPILLTISFYPFSYLLQLFMLYEVLIIHIKVFPGEVFTKKEMIFLSFKIAKFNIFKLNRFYKFYIQRRTGGTKEYFLEVIQEFQEKEQEIL